ncbi:MAG: response regulator transcription factor [Nitrospiraceae bacterium]|nr:response regulator transcription factor [Nitrospiraceae bacterium]
MSATVGHFPSTIDLYLVDDHEVVRVGLQRVFSLTKGIRVVGEAATIAAALAGIQRLQPDIVLMDIRMPDGNGVDAARQVSELSPRTQVLFLTSYLEHNTVLDAVVSGARGYVLKDIGSDALVNAIRTVAAGEPLLDPRVTQHTLRWIKHLSEHSRPRNHDLLSAQEQRMLPLLARGHTNKEIAQALGLSEKTVKNYLANIYSKLGITRRSQAAAYYASVNPLSGAGAGPENFIDQD